MPLGVSGVGDVVEIKAGKSCCTCWAIKPICGAVLSVGSIQLKVTGLRASIAVSDDDASSEVMFVLSLWSEFCVSVPASWALPPSKTWVLIEV